MAENNSIYLVAKPNAPSNAKGQAKKDEVHEEKKIERPVPKYEF